MKRCPKCNRSYPDDNQKFCTIDGGLLITASQAFDPNATIASSRPLGDLPSDESVKDELRDLAATIAFTAASTGSAPRPTRPTGPTGSETVYDLGAQRPSPPQTPPVTASPPPAPAPSVVASGEEIEGSANRWLTAFAAAVGCRRSGCVFLRCYQATP